MAFQHESIRQIRSYMHGRYVALSAVAGILIIAFAFNRFVLSKSTIIIRLTQENVSISVDGNPTSPDVLTDHRYQFTVLPGKHTITITADGAVNHKEIVEAKSGRTVEITPSLSIAPDAQSNTIGPITYSSYNQTDSALYYLGSNGHALMRYNITDGSKLALSDPIFRGITQLSWANDYHAVVVRNTKNNWFYLDLRKKNFVNAQFLPIAGPNMLDIQFDPTQPRIGFVGYKDGVLVFGVANASMQDVIILTKLDKMYSPKIVWSPSGTLVALIDDDSVNKQNVVLYNLASNSFASVDVPNVAAINFSPSGNQLVVSQEDSTTWLVNADGTNKQSLPALVQPKTISWLNETTLVALIRSQSGSELATIEKDTLALKPYGATPTFKGDVIAWYANSDKQMLYYVSDDALYTFPLLPASS